jgi:glycosyltransferase involved in cell wall biosynthesis
VYRNNPRAYERILSAADLVVAGNTYLARYAQKFNGNVIVLPTSVDVKAYGARKKAGKDFIVGWIGRQVNLPYLKSLQSPLEDLATQYNFKLKVISNFSDESHYVRFNNLEVINKPWSLEDELGDISDFDLGLMPLFDDEKSRGKCAFKAVQYMASGVPVLISNVGANRELVEDGVNGFLYDDHEEFITKFRMLIEDKDLRDRLSRNALRRIQADYNLDKNVNVLLSSVKRLISD